LYKPFAIPIYKRGYWGASFLKESVTQKMHATTHACHSWIALSFRNGSNVSEMGLNGISPPIIGI